MLISNGVIVDSITTWNKYWNILGIVEWDSFWYARKMDFRLSKIEKVPRNIRGEKLGK